MDDFVLNVREIAQFAAKDAADPTDAFMLQSGGLGGAYCWTTASGIVSPYLDPVVATFTADVQALQTTDSDLAATISGNYAALSEAIEQQGVALQAADQALQQQILNARLNSVWSFNGRSGAVQLTGADVFAAGAAPLKSPNFYGTPTAPNVDDPNQSDTQIANTAFVQRAAIARLADFMGSHPITWTFNGRTGDVLLQAKDVWGVGGVLRQKPYVPTPSISNYSDRIATTKWVMWHLDDLSVEIDDLRAKVEQQIDESALATKAYVDATFVTRQNSTLGGYATAPTPPLGTNNAQIATTAFVMNQIAESTAGVASFNGRTGNVVLEATDLGPFNLAPLDSPVFTGIPTAPTAVTGTATDQLATTAYVLNEIQAIDAGVVTFNGRSGAVSLIQADVAPFIAGLAPLDSPTFTGTPQVPTADAGTATNQAASTGFVTTAIADALGQLDTGVASWNGRTGTVSLLANDISAVGGALLASPNFTGTPTAPTASTGTSSTQLATTAFVQQALTGLNLGVQSFNGRAGNVTLTTADITGAGGYPVTGGALSGAPGAVQAVGHIDFVPSAPDTGLGRAAAFYSAGDLSNLTVNGEANAGVGFYSANADNGFYSANAVNGFFSGDAGTGFWSTSAQQAGFLSNSSNNNGFYSISAAANGFLSANAATGFSSANAAVNGFFSGGNPTWGIQISTQAGKPGGGAWVDNSDERIKKIYGNYDKGLDAVLALQPRTFVYRGNDTTEPPPTDEYYPPYSNSLHKPYAEAQKQFIGLVVQEGIEDVCPEMVTRVSGYIDGRRVDDIRQLDTTPLTYVLINAVKELAARVAALEAA